MIFAPIVTGVLAALVISGVRYLQGGVDTFWIVPVAIVAVGAATGAFQKFLSLRRKGPVRFNGVVDMLLQIQVPAARDSSIHWLGRGLISAALAVFSGGAGPEGSGAEAGYAFELKTRPRSARWYEQRRRTDAANSLGAAVSAAFGAPFAAVLLPIELGIGGRTITTVVCALSAFLASKFLATVLPIRKFEISGALYQVSASTAREWLALLIVAVIAGLVSAAAIRFFRYSQDGLSRVVAGCGIKRTWVGAALLALIFIAFHAAAQPPMDLLQDMFWSRIPLGDAAVLFFCKLLVLALVLAAFGTSGVFWPVFALGGFLGFAVSNWVLPLFWSDVAGLSTVSALIGATAFWAGILGAPVAGAVLVYEVTDNLPILLPALAAGWLAREIVRRMGVLPLHQEELGGRGVRLRDGRSEEVLKALRVRQAMVTDFETVHENEPVRDLRERLSRSRYPFLPVVSNGGRLSGLLTIDMIQDRIERADRVLEVKDLLYRLRQRAPSVRVDDDLQAIGAIFRDVPCVPVLDAETKLVGLLFVQNVRLAYENEVARRSLQS